MSTNQAIESGERTHEAIGIINTVVLPSSPLYIQHICPHCDKQNGESAPEAFVQCPTCGGDYWVPSLSAQRNTPGPWDRTSTAIYAHINGGGPGNRVLIASAVRAPGMIEGEADANARLIAVAPELLDALSEAEDALSWYSDEDTTVANQALAIIRPLLERCGIKINRASR